MYNIEDKANILASIPRHVAIIMDGNGRWAKKRGKLRIFGHKAGVKAIRNAINFAISNNIYILTLYAFSSENWSRPSNEIISLMKLFLNTLRNELKNFIKYNLRVCFIGDISRFNVKLQKIIHKTELLTCKNNGLILNIALNYSGRWDIIQGVKKLIKHLQKHKIDLDFINEENLCKFICMNDLYPVDLVIRTGGEYRISNFLLWQIAYSELFFTNVLWPDFNDSVFRMALNDFAKRERRFGSLTL